MTDNKKDIIIQVEIANTIYGEIDKLKKELLSLTPTSGQLKVGIDTSQIKSQDWSKIVPPSQVVNIKSGIDRGFHLNIKNVKQALLSLHKDATIPISITPIGKDALAGMTKTDWEKLSPPSSITDSIKKLNAALTSLGSRLSARKIGKGTGATTKSLSEILHETATAFDVMATSAARAAGAVSGVKTMGIASDPTKVRAARGKKEKEFDPSLYTEAELAALSTHVSLNPRQEKDYQKALAANASLRARNEMAGTLARNNASGMMDMGGLKGAMSRVLLFGSATSVLYGGIASIRKAIDVTIDLENEMVQLKKVMDDTTPFEEMKEQMFDLSEAMGVNILQTTKLAKIWAQQGYDMASTMKLTEVSMMAMNALNIDAAQSTDFLTSVTRVWGVELNELKKVMAGVMKVQADYAIESEDLTIILTKIGSGVRSAGDSMAFLSGAATALRETTRKSASQIYTSLKTIYAKSFSDDVVKALADVGVYAKMSQDQFRPFSDVLGDLASKWDTLSDAERKHLAIIVGQSRYWSDFVALMENFSIAQNATLSFYRAWDDASKASQLQQESLKNVLQGVASSFSKLGDTFGTRFFTPLVKGLSVPIKTIADLFSKIGGAQSALVMAASLAFLRNALKSVFGVFPAYEKFLGRAGLAGFGFTRSVIAQRAAIMQSISAGTRYGSTVRYIANNLELLTGTAGTARKAVLSLAVATERTRAIGALLTTSLKSIASSVASFALWTAAFWAAGEALDWIVNKFRGAKDEAKEFVESIPDDVFEKISAIGKTNKGTGLKITPFSDTKKSLDVLVDALIAKQKKLSTETDKYVLSWQDVEEVISGLDSNTIATLKANYGDLLRSVEDQKKLWEDIQTTVAITQNLVWGDTIKNAAELKTKLTTGFAGAMGAAKDFGDEFKKVTGLSNADIGDEDKILKAITKNMEKIITNPKLLSLANELNSALGYSPKYAGALFSGDKNSIKGLTDNSAFTEDLANGLKFYIGAAQYKINLYLKNNPIDVLSGVKIGGLDASKFKTLEEMQDWGQQIAGGAKAISEKIEKELTQKTKIGDINALEIRNKGSKPSFGELLSEGSGKAAKDLANLRQELIMIQRSYNAGALAPENVLGEQKKAYEEYKDSISRSLGQAQNELDELQKKQRAAFALIESDPNAQQFFKSYKPGKTDIIGHLIQEFDNLEEQSKNVGETFSEAAGASQDAAAEGNQAFAHNARILKTSTLDIENAKASLSELEKAYENLGETALQPLAHINYLLEQQTVFDKILKNNKEFLAKQSIDHLKQELTLREEIAKTSIDSEKNIAENYLKNFARVEQLKERELALHRWVALRKTEIDYEEQRRNIKNNSKVLPQMLPMHGFIPSSLTEIWNRRQKLQEELTAQEIENLKEQEISSKNVVNSQEDMYSLTQRIANIYNIWDDRLKSVQERTDFIRSTLADSITDFARINETHGLSVLTDTIGEIGKRFQQEQAKIFVNSVVNSKLGGFVLPSEEDLKFQERLNATGKTFYDSVYSAMQNGVAEMAIVMGAKVPVNADVVRMAENERQAKALGDIRKNSAIASLGALASSVGLSFVGGNNQNKQQGAQIGSIMGAMLPKLLFGVNPMFSAITSVIGMFGGGVLGSLFGGKAEKQQDTMISQLKLIEQNTARVADLTEKLVNIPGSVFLPPTGGFVMNGNIVINANGVSDPQQVVDMTVGRLTQEFGLAARRSGARGNLF